MPCYEPRDDPFHGYKNRITLPQALALLCALSNRVDLDTVDFKKAGVNRRVLEDWLVEHRRKDREREREERKRKRAPSKPRF